MKDSPDQKSAFGFFAFCLIPDKNSYRYLFVLILFGALALRLVGITWGLPNDRFELSLYETETETFEYILHLAPLSGDFDPDTHRPLFFNLIIGRALLGLGDVMGLCRLGPDMEFYKDHPGQLRRCFLLLRFWNLVLAMAGLVFIFGIGKVVAGNKVGLLAMTLAAVTPVHITESHFYTHQLRLCTYLALVVFLTLLAVKTRFWKFKAATAIVAGLTGAVLINGVFSFVAIPVILLSEKPRHLNFAKALFSKNALWLYLLFSLALFFAIGPQWRYAAMLLGQFEHVTNAEVFYRYPSEIGIGQILFFTFPFALGSAIYLVGILGVVWGLFKRRSQDIILLLFLGIYLLPILIFSVSRARYGLHILPFLALLGAIAIIEIGEKLPKKISRPATMAFIFATVGYSLLFSSALLGLLSKTTNVAQASVWMEQNVPSESRIGVISEFRRGLPSILDEGYFGSGKAHYPNIVSLEKEHALELPDDLDFVVTYDLELMGIYKKYLADQAAFPQKGALARKLLYGKGYKQKAIFQREPWIFKEYFAHPRRPLDLSFSLIAIRVFKNTSRKINPEINEEKISDE